MRTFSHYNQVIEENFVFLGSEPAGSVYALRVAQSSPQGKPMENSSTHYADINLNEKGSRRLKFEF